MQNTTISHSSKLEAILYHNIKKIQDLKIQDILNNLKLDIQNQKNINIQVIYSRLKKIFIYLTEFSILFTEINSNLISRMIFLRNRNIESAKLDPIEADKIVDQLFEEYKQEDYTLTKKVLDESKVPVNYINLLYVKKFNQCNEVFTKVSEDFKNLNINSFKLLNLDFNDIKNFFVIINEHKCLIMEINRSIVSAISNLSRQLK